MGNFLRNTLPRQLFFKLQQTLEQRKYHSLANEILSYYDTNPTSDEEIQSALNFIRKHGIGVFPQSFSLKYKKLSEVIFDPEFNLYFTPFHGKKLYLRSDIHPKKWEENFYKLAMEQDEESPHRYTNKAFNTHGEIIADIGAAEGNFSLMEVENAKKIYLFEKNPAWNEALNATFYSWKEKIEIVPKWVGNETKDDKVRLDDFFSDKEVTFLKIDVDGAERDLLDGANQLLQKKSLRKVAICTYHAPKDAEDFKKHLESFGFKTEFTKGYMLFLHDPNGLKPPYFRKGVLRAWRE